MSLMPVTQVRDSMRSAVLCTDMAQHSKLVDQLEFARQSHPVPSSPPAARPAQQRGGPAASASAPASGLHASGSQAEQLGRLAGKPVAQYTAGDRLLLLKALLHLADLSNPARPLPTGATWGCLVAKEFLAQVR
jgi:3'5'-cyclic nucleotide phosphodiesterase